MFIKGKTLELLYSIASLDQDRLQDAYWIDLKLILAGFGEVFGGSWKHFGKFLNGFWKATGLSSKPVLAFCCCWLLGHACAP